MGGSMSRMWLINRMRCGVCESVWYRACHMSDSSAWMKRRPMQQEVIEKGLCLSLPHYYNRISASVSSQGEYDEWRRPQTPFNCVKNVRLQIAERDAHTLSSASQAWFLEWFPLALATFHHDALSRSGAGVTICVSLSEKVWPHTHTQTWAGITLPCLVKRCTNE